MTREC